MNTYGQDPDERWMHPQHYRIRSSWNSSRMHIGQPLTDRKIEKYRKAGRYRRNQISTAKSGSVL